MPSELRILIIGPRLDVFGGVSGFYNSILPSLKATDNTSVKYHGVGEKPGFIGRYKIVSSLYDLLIFVRLLISYRPHLIHFNPSLSPFALIRDASLIIIAKFISKARVLVFFRGWNKKNESFVEKYFKFFNKSLLKADHYITLSEHSKNILIHWGVNEQAIDLGKTVIDEGIFSYLEKNSADRENYYLNQKLNVIILSRLVKEKGVYELLNAFSLVVKKHPDWTLTIAGDGPELNGLKSMANELDIANNIFFLGYVSGEDKYKALTQANVFCLPSYSEGMPNSVLEALAVGHTVVATPVGALENFCVSGWVIPVKCKCVESIAAALLNEELLSQLAFTSNKNRNFAKNNFRVEHVVSDLSIIYKKIIRRKV